MDHYTTEHGTKSDEMSGQLRWESSRLKIQTTQFLLTQQIWFEDPHL